MVILPIKLCTVHVQTNDLKLHEFLRFGFYSHTMIVNPTFNVGGQFNPDSQSGIPVTPFVGTGLNVGGNNGGFNPALTSNFAIDNGQAR